LHRRQTGQNPAAGPGRLELADLAPFPGAGIERDAEGWIAMRSRDTSRNPSGGDDELVAFKAWHPNDSTLRITGKALVDGSQARIDLISILRNAVFFPY
jgi:hypothetical protein